MLNFIRGLFSDSKGLVVYTKLLNEYLVDGILSETEQNHLNDLAIEYNIKFKDLNKIHKKAFQVEFKKTISDKIITEDEKLTLELLMDYFQLDPGQIEFDQGSFNKYYTLGLIEKGILPIVDSIDKLNIVLKKNEVYHWGCAVSLRKYKNMRRGYSGVTSSIKIMKGLSYRVGSYSANTNTELIIEENGFFWISNQRFGFHGLRKNFAMPFNKVLSFDLTEVGLIIHKEGRETPYIVGLDDYDIPCLVISKLLNT